MGPTVACTDGSEASTRALAAGLALLPPGHEVHLVTVVEEPDESLVTGSGFAGGTMSADEFDEANRATQTAAVDLLSAAAAELGLADATTRVLQGSPGPALCRYASEANASALVLGTRGNGGLKRAVLGSVSDHVIRNAPCPVIVTSDPAAA